MSNSIEEAIFSFHLRITKYSSELYLFWYGIKFNWKSVRDVTKAFYSDKLKKMLWLEMF